MEEMSGRRFKTKNERLNAQMIEWKDEKWMDGWMNWLVNE